MEECEAEATRAGASAPAWLEPVYTHVVEDMISASSVLCFMFLCVLCNAFVVPLLSDCVLCGACVVCGFGVVNAWHLHCVRITRLRRITP